MNEPTPPKSGGLWARLLSMGVSEEEPTSMNDQATSEGEATPAPAVEEIAVPLPVAVPGEPNTILLEAPVVPEPVAQPIAPAREEAPLPDGRGSESESLACPCCQATLKPTSTFCDDCGFMFSPGTTLPRAAAAASSVPNPSSMTSDMATPPSTTLRGRYQLQALIGERLGIRRQRGLDSSMNLPIVIVSADVPEVAVVAEDAPVLEEDDIMPSFDDVPVAVAASGATSWPSVAWEKEVLERAAHPGLPKVLDHFVEGNTEYLIEEVPQGSSLWDNWDDPDSVAEIRYGWLKQIAEALHALHQAGAILEGLRPDLVTVTANGAAINDLADMLPLPLPAGVPLRATLYTAPELILDPTQADARADLYSMGAMIYALEYLHHDLEEKDFEKQFQPKQVTDRFPDVHPLFPRLINKTFVRELPQRFPTDEAGRTDPTGFQELIRTFEICRKNFEKIRLDVAAWTTTGMVRTGNEDAFAFLHGVEGRQDDIYEYALVLLADGMGGYEAGEVAAAMAIAELRRYLLEQPLCAGLSGKDSPPPVSQDKVPMTKEVMGAALRHANKEVFTASRTPGKGKRGMGCTAEAVYIDCNNVIVGHVGDSRTYHLHQGRLVQLTRDQTLVQRLVELGQLTAEEAEHHDRKNELQQAIGGQPDVNPGLYHGRLKRGDWVLVCSDGLTNHIPNADLEKMLTREAASSAEEAARRLLNLVNLRGATDNATIVVVRAT